MKYIIYIVTLLCLLSLWSCNDEIIKSYESKPIALARMNEIIVIADNDLWESEVRDTFSYYFESAYPIMPTPEPMFDIRHFTVKKLSGEPLRKELRTYLVLVDLSDTESRTTKMVRKDLGEAKFLKAKNDPTFNTSVGKDKWARGQILVYIFGNSRAELNKLIRTNYPAIAKRIKLHDQEQLDASIYVLKKENTSVINDIKEEMNIEIRIPGDFVRLKEEEENYIWLKKDIPTAAMNIIIRKYPYTELAQLKPNHLIELRNDYGKKYISSPQEGSYMVSNTTDLPVYDYTYDIDGQYTKEIRGIWEMENDFLGGPYATYMIYNKTLEELIFIDTWVYAPGKKKIKMMMQLDYIVKNIKMVNS